MRRKLVKGGILLGMLVMALSMSACSRQDFDSKGLKDYHDPQLKMSRQEIEDELVPDKKAPTDESTTPPAIPDVSDILSAPPPPEKTGLNKLVSLSVTEDVPLKDVLLELGRLANVEMEIDASISGGIILRVKDRPFDQVMRHVAELGNLRYSYDHGVLRVQRDMPYVHNYIVDFLNLVRSDSGSLSVNTQVLGGSASSGDSTGGSSAGGLTSGSTNAVTTSYSGDLWSSVEQALTDILNFHPATLSGSGGASSSGGVGAVAGTSGTSNSGFTINKQAGVISVRGTEKQQRAVKRYLDQVRDAVSRQVLIEAKIVEVDLSKEYRSGINWSSLTDSKSHLSLNGNLNSSITSDGDFVTFALSNAAGSLETAVEMTEVFGTTRTISSPRLHAMNNQQAILTFAENNVYFTIKVNRQENTDTNGATNVTSSVESTLNTVPIGVIMTLQPSIDMDAKEITMNIRPTISRITSFVNDPGVELSAKQIDPTSTITSQVPIVEVREMDSVLKIHSGDIMVIGGLMEEHVVNNDVGVPYISRVPFLGNAFKSVEKTTDVVETVIFLKASIVPTTGSVGKHDKHFYKTFTRDPEPLTF